LVGPELDQFLLPDADLFPGQYTWRVQAACGETTPFPSTPFSEPDSFFVPRRSLCNPTVTDIDGHSGFAQAELAMDPELQEQRHLPHGFAQQQRFIRPLCGRLSPLRRIFVLQNTTLF